MSDYESVLADLPVDWKTATIEELGTVVSGGTPSREIANYWGGSIPWVTPGEVTTLKEKTLRLTNESITDEGLRQSGANLLPPGSVLVTTRASLGYCAINSVPVTTNQGFKSIVFRQSSNPDFYYHWTRKVSSELKRRASGTTFLEISGSDFKQIKLPVPPAAEQQKIAQILDTLDTQIQNTEALIAKLEKIKEGLLHDLLTRGTDQNGQLRPAPEQAPELYKESALGLIPKEWHVGPLEDALERIIDYRGKTPTKTGHGVPLITAKNVRMGYIAPEPREFIASSSYDSWMTRGIPSNTDVVFTTEAPLGNVAQVGTDEKVAFAQRVIILQPNSHLRPGLLKLLLMSSHFQGRAKRAASGSTALGIKQSVFRKLPIAHPSSMSEQDAISDIVRDLDERCASEFRCLAKFMEMKKGLMDDLLSGKVRVTPLLTSG